MLIRSTMSEITKRLASELSPPQDQPNSKKYNTNRIMEVGKLSVEEFSQLIDSKLAHLATKEDVKQELVEVKCVNECVKLKAQVEYLLQRDEDLSRRIEQIETKA